MNTYPVTYFKNHALELLGNVADTGDELIVTKHGRPLVHIEPVRTATKIELGRLSSTMEFNDDITAPLGEDDWNACS